MLGADTIVVVDGLILGKPSDAADAARMLRLISGRVHSVITGVCLVAGGQWSVGSETTLVSVSEIPESEIDLYLCTQLIRALEPRVPNLKIVVSSTTTTGMAELRRRLPTHVSKIYYPIDRRKYVRRALATINPEGHRAGRGGNLAELSLARAATGHSGFSGQRAAVRPLVSALQKIRAFCSARCSRSFAGVGCQNEEDAARLRAVGCRPESRAGGGQPEI